MEYAVAEEFGLTRDNVEGVYANTTDPKIQRFLGKSGDPGAIFGIRKTFAYDIVHLVGNYGELFEQSLGSHGLGMDRGLNKPWTEGGLLISWLWQ